jgi:hypothetical protein
MNTNEQKVNSPKMKRPFLWICRQRVDEIVKKFTKSCTWVERQQAGGRSDGRVRWPAANERLLLLLAARPICAPVRTKTDTHTDTLTHRTHRPTKRRKRMTGRSVTASVNWIRAATHTPPNLLRMALRRGVVSTRIGRFQVTPISGRPISGRTLRPPVFFVVCWPLGDDSRILSYESRSADIISCGPSPVRHSLRFNYL